MTEANPATLRRVRSLLDLAEHTDTPPEERDHAMATAMRIMALHGIARAQLTASGGAPDPIDTTEVELGSSYTKGKCHLLWRIAKALRCKSIYHIGGRRSTVVGAASDRERVIMLYTSLLIQFATEASKLTGDSAGRTRALRAGFLWGFANRVGERLADHEGRAVAEASDSSGVALVLSDRSVLVDQRYAELFPEAKKLKKVKTDLLGRTLGAQAAERADIGITRVGVRQHALPGGER